MRRMGIFYLQIDVIKFIIRLTMFDEGERENLNAENIICVN